MEEKNPVGAPLKFPTPNDLQKAVDKYFKEKPFKEWTVTGLALVLGTKQIVAAYLARPAYSEILLVAKLKIENSYEYSLRENGKAGDIFALKNMGWTDKKEVEHSGGVNITSRTEGMTDEEIDEYISNSDKRKED